MAVGTSTSVTHNVKTDEVAHESRERLLDEATSCQNEEEKTKSLRNGGAIAETKEDERACGKHRSHDLCTTCGSLADERSCKDCECRSTIDNDESIEPAIEPAIKSATSSTVVCGGACIAAAQRAAAGRCPGCECPASGCRTTQCSCSICNPNQVVSARNCPACDCPAGNCPCTDCKCPLCKSS